MTLRRLTLPALALLVGALAAGAADKLQMRQHWESGKVYHFETILDWQVTTKPADEFSLSVVMLYHITVKNEPGSERKLAEVKFTSTKAIINVAGAIETYDSDNPATSSPTMRKDFGVMIGKGFALVYDKDDHFVEAIVPKDFTAGAEGAHAFISRFREDFQLGLPEEGLALGDGFKLDKVAGSNLTGPIVSKMMGRLDGIVNHEGRKHAKLVMEGSTAMSDEKGEYSLQPGTMVGEEILFDLERRSISRHMSKNHSHRPRGNEIGKTERVTTLKSVEDAVAAKK